MGAHHAVDPPPEAVGSPTAGRPDPRPVDPRYTETTRQLAAAVHVDERLADELIDELLSRPRRAVPPSPGVEQVIVLSEALIGRRRRVLRDSLVLLLATVVMVALWPLSLSWPAGIGAGLLTLALVRGGRRSPSVGGWVLVTVLTCAAGLATALLSGGWVTVGWGRPLGGAPTGVETVFALVAGALLLAVLIADRMWVYGLLRNRFGPGWYHLNPPVPWPPPPSAWYTRRLGLIARAGLPTNTHVHDGHRTFVGAGKLTASWSMAVQLRPTTQRPTAQHPTAAMAHPTVANSTGEDPATRYQGVLRTRRNGSAPPPLTPSTIYRAVVEEVLAMRSSDGLAPGQRMAGISYGAELLTSANALLAHAREPVGAAILPDPRLPPANHVDPALIDRLTDRPPEWVRPYLCLRIGGWQQELMTSAYLHAGCDDTTLYLEWNAYQLNPIRPEYRHGPMVRHGGWRVVPDAVGAAVTVPGSVVARLRLLVRALADAGGVPARVDPLDPGRSYGARRSIREIAADRDTRSYLQDMDGVRNVKLLERKTLAAVDKALRAHGLCTDEFARQTATVITSSVVRGGTPAHDDL
jgi:hypothetical protein